MPELRPRPTVCFENALALVQEEPAGEYMTIEWRAAPWHERQARQACEYALQCLQEKGWHKLLINRMALPVFRPVYHTWLLYDWLPRAYRAGLVCYVLVLPREIFSRMAFEDLVMQSWRQHVCCWMTTSTAEATNWLLQQVVEPHQAPQWLPPGAGRDTTS